MYNILTLNKISKAGLSRLGDNYNVADSVENPDAVLVRSASMHDMNFLQAFSQSQEQVQASTIFLLINAQSRVS